MNDENKAPGPLSLIEAQQKLKQSRERSLQPQEEPEAVEPVVEEVESEDQANAEIEATTEDQAEVEEVQEDQTETEDETEVETDDGSEVYEVDGVEFTASELKAWKESGMLQADYTRKTQEVAKTKAQLATEKQQFDSERAQVTEALQQQHAQLQDALTTFAIEQDPEPAASQFKDWSDYAAAKSEWDGRAAKRAQAQQLHQAMQQEQHQITVQKEMSHLIGKWPEISQPETFASEMQSLKETASQYGYSPQEFEMLTDHRVFLALRDLRQLGAAVDTKKATETATQKKVVKAAKRLTPTAKQKPTTSAEKALSEAKRQHRKHGTPQTAMAVRRAQRALTG